MTWFARYRKYKILVKDLLFERAELDFVRTVVKDITPAFERAEVEFLKQKYISVENIEKIQIKNAPQSPVKKEPDRLRKKHFSRMYKSIAKKLHPDKFSRMERTQEVIKKEEMFRVIELLNE